MSPTTKAPGEPEKCPLCYQETKDKHQHRTCVKCGAVWTIIRVPVQEVEGGK